MDFWFYIQLQKSKLDETNDLEQLIDDSGKIKLDHESLEAFRNHLPIEPEEFWQTIVDSIVAYEKDPNFQLDESLMNYILILISWYTDEEFIRAHSLHPDQCNIVSLLAAQFYLHLLTLVKFKYFKGHIYKSIFAILAKKKNARESSIFFNLLKALRRFLLCKHLNKKYLEMTLLHLCDLISKQSSKIYIDFTTDNPLDSVHASLLCIKTVVMEEERSTKSQFIINYALLLGIRTEFDSMTLKRNFRNLIMHLKPVLKKDDFSNFQNVYLYITAKSRLFDAVEARLILTTLDEQFCKGTVMKLTTMALSKNINKKTNILNLFTEFLQHIPLDYYEVSKVNVLIQIILNICFSNCMKSDEAVHVISKLCLLNKSLINEQLTVLLNTPTEFLYVEKSLPKFCMEFNLHWRDRMKNRNLAVIILRIMCSSFSISSDEQYSGIISMIGSEADPSDLKMCIPSLLELYIISKKNNSKYLSVKILELMYSMAIHQSSGSGEFMKVLLDLCLEPTEEIKPFKFDFLTTLSVQIIDDNKIFVKKANEMKLLNDFTTKRMVRTIINGDYDGLRLACAVIEEFSTTEGEKVIYHIMTKPDILSEAKYTADLLFLINCGLKCFMKSNMNKSLTPNQQTNFKEFMSLLWDGILKFRLAFNALGIALDVLKSLSILVKEELQIQTFHQSVNFELKTTLMKTPSEISPITLMYAAELISNEDFRIPEETVLILQKTIDKIANISKEEANSEDIKLHTKYYYCLTLLVRLAMKHSRLGSKTMKYLETAVERGEQEFKMSIMDLMYDLCVFVVHNFEEFLQYSFNDLKSINYLSRKQAATHIEHFLRLDYLKLSVEQYCKFISLLGDPRIDKTVQNLITNFVFTNQTIVEKYFLALVMHINFYSVHPLCPMSPQYMQDMNCIIRANFNKWKVFSTLFRPLPSRSKFLILKEICSSFFDKFIRGKLKIEDDIWNVMNDAISLFKIMAYKTINMVKYEDFFDEGMQNIKKYIIEKKHIPSNLTTLKYADMKCTIEFLTYNLLHLLFYTENETILRNFKLKLFEAIMFWTHDLFPDIAGICSGSKKEKMPQKIANYYQKLHDFYINHKQCLNINEYISENNETKRFCMS